jgi:hypothetical protein
MTFRQDGRHTGELGAILVLTTTAIVIWLALRGGFSADFGDDEASHVVSSLLLLDALHGLFRGTLPQPIELLREFHGHYPLVGIGHWPPFYYAVLAIWMALTAPTRAALLMLSALVTAAAATRLYAIVARRNGRVAGVFATGIFLACPLVREAAGEVMLDLPVALLCLLAVEAYWRYAVSLRNAFAVLFGVVSAAALLTKGTAICLALLPPFFVLLAGRWDLLRRASFFLPAVMVGVVAVPWYVLTYRLVAPGFRHAWGAEYSLTAVAENAAILFTAVGPVMLLVAGAALLRCTTTHGRADPELAAFGALLAAVLVFQCIVPAAFEPRYLLPAIPPLLILGTDWIAWFFRRGRRQGVAAGVIAVSFLPLLGASSAPPHFGMATAARQVWANLPVGNRAVLIAADAGVEAAAVAELALRDPQRPSLFAIRGSRLLGGGGYNNSDYRPRFNRLEDVAAAIDRYGIGLVLSQSSDHPKVWEHVSQVARLAVLESGEWEPVWHGGTTSDPMTLYRITPNLTQAADSARLIALSAPRALASP